MVWFNRTIFFLYTKISWTFLLFCFSSDRISNSSLRCSHCNLSSVLRTCSCFSWDFTIWSNAFETFDSTWNPRVFLFSKFSILSKKYFFICPISRLISSLISAWRVSIFCSTTELKRVSPPLCWLISLSVPSSDLILVWGVITTFHD